MTQEANSDELIHLRGDEGLEGVGGEAQEGASLVVVYTKYLPLLVHRHQTFSVFHICFLYTQINE